ncbi:uncharacterized protein LAESUDRAFT_453310 [Laetiporus sulphureus 93-53]|uniref:Uncharacterized protein n=1 Tax=Laetiporus sulphureus 93-53 TaxID=1314785 RepID=A0A165BUL9_9APHY|nr:uncharacterized protein LAESUDRAFT_453310 [Laetiporus sulphureus 93-53]KZT01686.1 hypothetical protein LAESUDRAFT_453310 [Laetiporus sulphureus 93-53]
MAGLEVSVDKNSRSWCIRVCLACYARTRLQSGHAMRTVQHGYVQWPHEFQGCGLYSVERCESKNGHQKASEVRCAHRHREPISLGRPPDCALSGLGGTAVVGRHTLRAGIREHMMVLSQEPSTDASSVVACWKQIETKHLLTVECIAVLH